MKSKFLNEFKQFAMRGNVIDLAVGVIIGAAFSKITSSLVGDIIMPPIGALYRRGKFYRSCDYLKTSVCSCKWRDNSCRHDQLWQFYPNHH